MRLNLAAQLLLLHCLAAAGEREIKRIDSSNFADVSGDSSVWLVHFFASESSHSMKFSSDWLKLAGSLKRVKVGSVNVDSSKGAELLEKLSISRVKLPNLKLFKHVKPADHAVGIMDG